ncbi:MAG: CHAT domain-containing protein [Ignavibacteriae bacterium]|nr:CHAT domain-containing protein [Ignavibacteriota bacterium]
MIRLFLARITVAGFCFIAFFSFARAQTLDELISSYNYYYEGAGLSDSAFHYLKEIRTWLESNGETDTENYANVLELLAEWYKDDGKIDSALLLYHKGLEVKRSVMGEQHLDYAISLDNLGLFYGNLGDYESSLPLIVEALEIFKVAVGDQHPDYAICLWNLGSLYHAMGSDDLAIPLYEEILEIKKFKLRKNKLEYANFLRDLGDMYDNVGNYYSAIEVYKSVVDIKKRLPGISEYDYVSDLSSLASLYRRVQDYSSALPLYKKVVEIFRIVDGVESKNYAIGVNNLALLYEAMDEYEAALPLFIESIEITRVMLGPRDPEVATLINNLGLLYCSMGNYEAALPLLEESHDIRYTVLGENHPDYAMSLNNLGMYYSLVGDYDSAIPLLQSALELKRLIYGENHPAIQISLHNLGRIYMDIAYYSDALIMFQEALDLVVDVYGTESPYYATELSDLGRIYFLLGDYSMAMSLYQESLELNEKIYGKQGLEYASSLEKLADLYVTLDDLSSALKMHLEVMEIRGRILGEQSIDYAASLLNLASLYSKMIDYSTGLTYAQKGLDIIGYVAGKQNSDYASGLRILSQLYNDIGDIENSKKLQLKALEIDEIVLGTLHPDYALDLVNLAGLYELIEDYSHSIELLRQAMEIFESKVGKQHEDYAVCLSRIGNNYLSLNKMDSAKQYFEEALEINKEMFGDSHSEYANSLYDIGAYYFKNEDYKSAVQIYQECLKIVEKVYGIEHPICAGLLYNMGLVYDILGDVKVADRYYLKEIEINFSESMSSLKYLSEQQQKKYWNNYNTSLESIQSFYIRNGGEVSSLPTIFNLYLESNGVLLSSKRSLLSWASTSDDTMVFETYREFKRNCRLLYSEENLPIENRHYDIDSLNKLVNLYEEQLTRLGSERLNLNFTTGISWEDIEKALEPKELVICFSHFNYMDLKSWTDSVMYAAYVIPYGTNKPIFIPLFEEMELVELIERSQKDPNALYGYSKVEIADSYVGDDIWSLVWGELTQFLEGVDKIYFTASGLLNEINLSALPDGLDQKHQPMLVNYNMMQMLHPGKVMELKKKMPDVIEGPIVAFGGLNYDIDSDDWLVEAGDNDIESRGIDYFVSDSTRSGYHYLPYTLTEVDAIAEIANNNSIPITVYTGNSGVEERYYQLHDDRSPQILHLATHAIFLEDVILDNHEFNDDPLYYNAYQDPMFRSRLVLSGANRVLKGKKLPTGVMDGILTAHDVSTILLPNTKLAVLSACNTGIGGYDASEGVYGLQRAFSSVGVQNLIITLMEVNDASTARFMKLFYEKLLNGSDYYTSFKNTQLEMLNSQYNLPAYWAGIVLIQ